MSGTLQSNLRALFHFPCQQFFELDTIITQTFQLGKLRFREAEYIHLIIGRAEVSYKVHMSHSLKGTSL